MIKYSADTAMDVAEKMAFENLKSSTEWVSEIDVINFIEAVSKYLETGEMTEQRL